jgi:hypothetical protein
VICPDCKAAGAALDLDIPELVEKFHAKCKGDSWCDCQHKTETVLKGGTS